MNAKKARRHDAIKKAQKRRMAVIFVCVIIGAAFTGLIIFASLQVSDGRVFVSGGSHITLHEDGGFTAHLPHNTRITGSYEEFSEDDNIFVAFTSNRGMEIGSISGRVLTIPDAWVIGCRHGHGTRYTLRSR